MNIKGVVRAGTLTFNEGQIQLNGWTFFGAGMSGRIPDTPLHRQEQLRAALIFIGQCGGVTLTDAEPVSNDIEATRAAMQAIENAKAVARKPWWRFW